MESWNGIFVSRLGGAVAISWVSLGGEMGFSVVLRVRVWACGGGGGSGM